MHRFIKATLMASIAFAATAGRAQEPADLAALFAKYTKIVNAGDVAGLRAMISEDVERSAYRGCTPAMSNRDCLTLYVENTVIKNHGKIEETGSFGIDGDTLFGGLVLKSDVIHAAGSKRVLGIDEMKIKDRKIIGMKFLPNLQDPQTAKYFDHIRATGTPSSQPYVNR